VPDVANANAASQAELLFGSRRGGEVPACEMSRCPEPAAVSTVAEVKPVAEREVDVRVPGLRAVLARGRRRTDVGYATYSTRCPAPTSLSVTSGDQEGALSSVSQIDARSPCPVNRCTGAVLRHSQDVGQGRHVGRPTSLGLAVIVKAIPPPPPGASDGPVEGPAQAPTLVAVIVRPARSDPVVIVAWWSSSRQGDVVVRGSGRWCMSTVR